MARCTECGMFFHDSPAEALECADLDRVELDRLRSVVPALRLRRRDRSRAARDRLEVVK